MTSVVPVEKKVLNENQILAAAFALTGGAT